MKILDRVKVLALAGVLAVAGVVAVLPGRVAYAVGGLRNGVNETTNGTDLKSDDLEGSVATVINIILYAIGIVAVIMIIFGGFQYITSSGDAAKVTKAKNTILYGIVGLVIAVLAYAIVNFVLNGIGVYE